MAGRYIVFKLSTISILLFHLIFQAQLLHLLLFLQDIEATIHCAEWLSIVGGSSTGEKRIRYVHPHLFLFVKVPCTLRWFLHLYLLKAWGITTNFQKKASRWIIRLCHQRTTSSGNSYSTVNLFFLFYILATGWLIFIVLSTNRLKLLLQHQLVSRQRVYHQKMQRLE